MRSWKIWFVIPRNFLTLLLIKKQKIGFWPWVRGAMNSFDVSSAHACMVAKTWKQGPAQFCLSHLFCLDIHSKNLGIKTEKLPSYHLILLTFIPTAKYLQKYLQKVPSECTFRKIHSVKHLQKVSPKNTFNKHSQINTLSEMPSAKHLQKDLQKITFKK